MISAEQIRAARALMRIEQDELARRARVSATTVRRIEAAGGLDRVSEATVGNIRRALEEAGAEFIDNGVRRRRSTRDAETRYRKLKAIAERAAPLIAAEDRMTDADLYDENGLPA
jgi:transcriptional regulator with XRE-family HTH domain